MRIPADHNTQRVRYGRKDPPTEKEIEQGEAQRAYTLRRAKEIEEEDQRQRSLEFATGERAPPNNHSQDARIAYLSDRIHGNARASGGHAQPSGEANGSGLSPFIYRYYSSTPDRISIIRVVHDGIATGIHTKTQSTNFTYTHMYAQV